VRKHISVSMYIDEEGKEKTEKERKGKGGEQRCMTV
jgi:hypothetical protein